jgi:predicted RNase H-like HicB family nuclease
MSRAEARRNVGMARYIALIRKTAKSAFGVDFPDFPGCVSAGKTLESALVNAREALALHIEGLREDGEALPAPSSLDAVMADPHNGTAAAVLIDAPPARGRVARVNITLDESILRRIDETAERIGTTRSGFLVSSALDRMGRLEEASAPYDRGGAARKGRGTRAAKTRRSRGR